MRGVPVIYQTENMLHRKPTSLFPHDNLFPLHVPVYRRVSLRRLSRVRIVSFQRFALFAMETRTNDSETIRSRLRNDFAP